MSNLISSQSTSLGIWLEGEKDYYIYELHVNIWITGSTKDRYLELGIKIPEVEGLDYVNVFVPYSLQDKYFQDLGGTLAETPRILSAIFNKNVTITNNHGQPTNFTLAQVKDIGDLKVCKISDRFKQIESRNDGSIIKINFNLCCPNQSDRTGAFYLRFRLNNLQALHAQRNGPHFWFSGKKESFSFLDFKLNYFRTLPDEIAPLATKDHLQEIHLFLLSCTNISIDLNTKDPNDIRLIEGDLWSSYLYNRNAGKRCDDEIVAFHWYEKNEYVENIIDPIKYRYELFAKLSSQQNNWKFISIAIGLTIIIAIMSSMLSTFLYSSLFDEHKSNEKHVTEAVTKEQNTISTNPNLPIKDNAFKNSPMEEKQK
ncbi:hypothetical protein [Thiomicrorhabdus sp.]|uniref:hypothetical protein n=1 Tax=Thiomicrorhabdus sp. TaxID=2039724 RepID=UPI0029C943FD|nr:hypothetical protein [Thiomicrorhabdus sp.]